MIFKNKKDSSFIFKVLPDVLILISWMVIFLKTLVIERNIIFEKTIDGSVLFLSFLFLMVISFVGEIKLKVIAEEERKDIRGILIFSLIFISMAFWIFESIKGTEAIMLFYWQITLVNLLKNFLNKQFPLFYFLANVFVVYCYVYLNYLVNLLPTILFVSTYLDEFFYKKFKRSYEFFSYYFRRFSILTIPLIIFILYKMMAV